MFDLHNQTPNNNTMATVVSNTPAATMSEFAQDAIKAARSAARAPRASAKVKITPAPETNAALPIPVPVSLDTTTTPTDATPEISVTNSANNNSTNTGTNNNSATTSADTGSGSAGSGSDTVDDPIQSDLTSLSGQVSGLLTTLKDIAATIKGLQRSYQRQCKAHAIALNNAVGKKRVARTGEPRQQALGTASPAMTAFLGLTPDTFLSRRDVVTGVNQYIKRESLQLPTDGRVIVPNDALRTLLNVEPDATLTYFNMQKLINPHFKVAKKNSEDGSLEAHNWEE